MAQHSTKFHMVHANTVRVGVLCLFGLIVCALSGCTNNVTISDTKLSDLAGEVKSVRIIIEDTVPRNEQIWISDPELASKVDSFTRAIWQKSEASWPSLFSSYGLLVELTRTSTQKTLPHFSIVLIEPPKTNAQYELLIKRNAITPKPSGSFSVEYIAELRRKEQAAADQLWRGTITIQPGMWASENSLAGEMGKYLLNQWQRDGIVIVRR